MQLIVQLIVQLIMQLTIYQRLKLGSIINIWLLGKLFAQYLQ